MLTKLSIYVITFYQRYLSPHKGYCCAYKAYTGEDSCSQYAKVVIAEHGLFSSFPLIKEQFEKCSFAAQELKKKPKKKKKKESTIQECAGDAVGEVCGSDCFPSRLFKKKSSNSSYDNCDIGGCDTIGDCHPFH